MAVSASGVRERGRPRPGASVSSPDGPNSLNLFSQRRTVGLVVPSSLATSRRGVPSAAARMIRLLKARRCGLVGARTQRSSICRASEDKSGKRWRASFDGIVNYDTILSDSVHRRGRSVRTDDRSDELCLAGGRLGSNETDNLAGAQSTERSQGQPSAFSRALKESRVLSCLVQTKRCS
jgi:hypothetical protein